MKKCNDWYELMWKDWYELMWVEGNCPYCGHWFEEADLQKGDEVECQECEKTFMLG
jgi:hypothetical protein